MSKHHQPTRREVLGTLAGTSLLCAAPRGLTLSALRSGEIEAGGLPAQVTITPVSPRTVRISIQALVNGEPQPIPDDGALVQPNWSKPAAVFHQIFGSRHVRCGQLTVDIAADPFQILVSEGAELIQEFTAETGGGMRFQLGDGTLLGLGQGGPQFDRRGALDRMTSGQGGYRLGTNGGKMPVQLLIGTRRLSVPRLGPAAGAAWAIFAHSPLGAFDLTGSHEQRGALLPFSATPGAAAMPADGAVHPALPLDLFVIAAHEPGEVMFEYARITGFAEMPPLWSLGYLQSHRTLGTPEEILAEARTFRDKKLPCDAMIYLGTDFCPNGWNTHNGEFTWNPKAFPDPPAALQSLHEDHFKVVLHTVLEGRRLTGSVDEPCTAAPLPSGRTPDGRWPDDRQVSCYWPVHKPLLDQGIDGWWPDQGDGLDAPSRLARNRMYFDGTLKYRPNQRVFALHRNGCAGMQRYAAFLWSGDVNSTWETLKTHIAVGINAGLSGIPYWGTDIGGFIPTDQYTGELYLRWFQFGAFCPLFRSHGRDWRLHLPWGWTTGDIGFAETPSYRPPPEVLHNPAIEPLCKKYLELRYQLLPYLYTAVKACCETGLPVIRALWLHYPGDEDAAACGDQFLFGRDMLVAPVYEKNAAKRSVYLPRGSWYDFWSGELLDGGKRIDRTVDLGTIPIYVRAGAIIPMGPIKQYAGELSDQPVTLRLFPGADGAASLYEDDGASFDFRQGDFTRFDFNWKWSNRELSVKLAPGSRLRLAAARSFQVQQPGDSPQPPFEFTGKAMKLTVPPSLKRF